MTAKALNEMVFFVDPLDGTKEFVKKNGEFTINIALSNGESLYWGSSEFLLTASFIMLRREWAPSMRRMDKFKGSGFLPEPKISA